MIDLMELSNEITRFRSDDQYLKEKVDEFLNDAIELLQLVNDLYNFKFYIFKLTYTVTLKIRKSLKALNTDKPKEPAFGLKCDHMTSKTLPEITMQSKRLNEA